MRHEWRNMRSLNFKAATLADLDRIMELEAAGFDPGHWETRQVYAQRIEVFPEGSLLAFHEGESVGCVFCEIWHETSDGPVQAEHFTLGHDILERHDPVHGNTLYIASMVLDPALHGRGWSQPLLQGCLAQLASAYPRLRSALLLVNTNWTAARRTYTAAGFQEVAQFPGFFQPRARPAEDGIVMRSLLLRP